MTTWNEVQHDPRYVKILDAGFCGLIDVMGDDTAIVQAARTSYGKGTKGTREDRGLIRYLMRHWHTSPIEQVEFKFHLKMPIFVMRQHVRHRTANLNEYSGRYSVMTDEFYIPEPSRLQSQSDVNKQGSGEVLGGLEAEVALNTIKRISDETYKDYLTLVNAEGGHNYGILDRKGLSRELARIILPLNNYTELYWKIDLKNLFHYLKLRNDSHAQDEIRWLAQALADVVKSKCPIAYEAFEDYWEQSVSVSRMERNLLNDLFETSRLQALDVQSAFDLMVNRDEAALVKKYGLTKRELKEFKETWKLI